MFHSAGKSQKKSFRVRRQSRSGTVIFRGGSPAHKIRQASLSVECALVLPLFFFFLLPLIAFPQALALQAKTNLELSNAARQLSAAAHLAGGEEWIDLQKRESYTFLSPGLLLPRLQIACRARVYPFTGYVPGSDDAAEGTSERSEMVYVTENQSVYHSFSDCSHLSLSVFSTTEAAAKAMRNADGERYRPCPGFPKDYSGPVYLTERGRYYYPSSDYGSLTRHVRLIEKESLGDLCLCSRCAARQAGALDAEGGEENAAA